MSNIREYTRKKENAQTKDYKKEIRKHRLAIFYRTSLAVVVVIAIVTLISFQEKNKVYESYQVVAEVPRSAATTAWSKNLGGYVLNYSKDGANCADTKGNVIWNQTYEMQSPIVDICENTVAIGDYNGNSIFVMDTTGIKGEIDTGMPIRDFCVAANGVVAVILDDATTTWIYLFDSQGKTLSNFKTTMKISGYPVEVAISNSGILLGVSFLYVDSGEVKNRVAFYNFGDVGQNQIDKLVSGYDYSDSIVPEMKFMNGSTVFALADNRLMIYKGDQIPSHHAETLLADEIQSVFYNEKYIGLVCLETSSEEKYRLDLYNDSGKVVQSIRFNMQYKDILIEDEKITIYNDSECVIYSVNGLQKYEGTFLQTVHNLIPTAKANKYLAITDDKIQTIELR